ncbi:MAG: hypothetical protein H7X74_07650 [Methyloceanibacter sp.]|nr:hypothetical protein [Methyloceanibacter sp.]
MIGSKYIFIMAVVVAVGASGLSPKSAQATDDVPGDRSLIEKQGTPSSGAGGSETEPQPPRTPIRLSTIDYKDTGEGSGKLTLAGIALPGNDLYLFFDDQPFAKVVPDDGGKWSVEGEMKLDDGRHSLRAEQYDPATQMLAGRATISIGRAAPEQAAPAPKATTP